MKNKLNLVTIMILLVCFLFTTAISGCSPEGNGQPAAQEENERGTAEEESEGNAVEEENKAPDAKMEELVIASSQGSIVYPLAYMMDNNMMDDWADDVNTMFWREGDQLSAMLTSEQVDFACMPLTMVFMLYNKDVDIKLVNVAVWGMLYVLGQDTGIATIEDLKGKEIALTNFGGLHDVILRHILTENNIDPENDLSIIEMDMTEMSTKLAMGEIDLAILNEPKSSATIAAAKANNIELKRLLDLEEEWRKITPNKDGKIPQSGLVVVGKNAENKALVDDLSARYIESAGWVNNNREEAGKIVEKYFEQMKAGGVSASLPYAKLNPVPAKECRKDIEAFFNEYLKTASPKVIGGQMPDEDIYYVSE